MVIFLKFFKFFGHLAGFLFLNFMRAFFISV